MFSTSIPDQIHLSKLGTWLSSQKGIETSLIKALESSELCRQEVEEALTEARKILSAVITDASAASLRPQSYKPKIFFTFFDYQECLKAIAEANGIEKNIFGAFTEPTLVTASDALKRWEAGSLHLVSGADSIAKLCLLTYPSAKSNVDLLHSRVEELSRQMNEHERLAHSYGKKCHDLCRQWGVALSTDGGSGPSPSRLKIHECPLLDCQSDEVAAEVLLQLQKCASAAHRQAVFEHKVLPLINTPDTLEGFLHYHSYMTHLASDLRTHPSLPSEAAPASHLPLLQAALRAGGCLTDMHSERLPRPCTASSRSSSLGTSSSLEGEWMHVSADEAETDCSERREESRDAEGAGVREQLNLSSESFLRQMENRSLRAALLQELVLLRGVLAAQLREGTSGRAISSNSKGEGILPRAMGAVQKVLSCFATEEFLNMLALEDSPALLSRVHQDILLNYNKSSLFGRMASCEAKESVNLKNQLAERKAELSSVRENISFLKNSLEAFLSTKYSSSGGVEILGASLEGIV